MKTRPKIEYALIGLLIVLNFFLIKGKLGSLPFLAITVGLSVYFFPVKLILDFRKVDYGKALLVFSCLVASITIVMTYVSWILRLHGEDISAIFFGVLIANLILAILFSTKDKQSLILHLLLLVFVSESIFV